MHREIVGFPLFLVKVLFFKFFSVIQDLNYDNGKNKNQGLWHGSKERRYLF
jgi:hypothetical protein